MLECCAGQGVEGRGEGGVRGEGGGEGGYWGLQ